MVDDDAGEDTEDVVLTRWDKIKQWVEIAMATKKMYMFGMTLLFGTGGAVVVGGVTDTNLLHDAAVSIGLVDKGFTPKDFTDHIHDYPDLPVVDLSGLAVKGHQHAEKAHTHPEITQELRELLPENHGALH